MNRLASAQSLYLRQHANNPVHWWPWCDEAWNQAKIQNKLVIVSIGYSACHWCHVMEREVFEHASSAEIMNQHFICIKVDREEHPHIDAVYMDAVHVMGRQGGWPLNMITTSQGIPVFGGTYFPKHIWEKTLQDLFSIQTHQPEELHKYADHMREALNEWYSKRGGEASDLHALFEDVLVSWSKKWDRYYGGDLRAPKFPMADEYLLLLAASQREHEPEFSQHVQRTLHRIHAGGIFDAVGGGICRYSVDERWHIPHFEKMLYDNANMLLVYSRTAQITKDPEFLWAAEDIYQWLQREMRLKSGLYAASLDADVNGVEGSYYAWTASEWNMHLGDDSEWTKIFQFEGAALWEHDLNVLYREKSWQDCAEEWGGKREEIYARWREDRKLLLNARKDRPAPSRDDKMVLSWNAMLISALIKYEVVSSDSEVLKEAQIMFDKLSDMTHPASGWLAHTNTLAEDATDVLLEDYAFLSRAALDIFKCCGDVNYLDAACRLVNQLILQFSDDTSSLFRQCASVQDWIGAQRMDIEDNVISSANSVVCGVLFELGYLIDDASWTNRAYAMRREALSQVRGVHGSARWLWETWWMQEHRIWIVVSGEHALQRARELRVIAPFHWEILPLTSESELAIFKNRFTPNETTYVCVHELCLEPITGYHSGSDLFDKIMNMVKHVE